MNKKEKAVFRLFLMLGGASMVIDGICWIVSIGYYSPSLCLKLAGLRTDWMLARIKANRNI